jgi:hypothetical protein
LSILSCYMKMFGWVHILDLLSLVFCVFYIFESRGSSVSIVSYYGLDDRGIGVRSLAEAKGFFL